MGDETQTEQRSLLEQLQAKKADLLAEIEPLVEGREKDRADFEARERAEKEEDRPTAEERSEFADAEARFKADADQKLAELRALDGRISEQETLERSRELGNRASQNAARVVSEPEVYARMGDRNAHSYFIDLACRAHPSLASKFGAKADGWEGRLERHAKMMEDVMPKRAEQRKREAEARIETAERETRQRWLNSPDAFFETSPFEKRAPSREPGQGGYFVPPLWLIDEYIPFLRPGRVAAGLMRNMVLPPGTDSINVPKLTTPTVVGVQSADNAPVPSQDIKDNFINASVKTIAGFADLPLQLIEQSPGTIIDQVITRDMMAAYDVELDKQALVGKGIGAPLSGGEIKGIYPTSNWEATAVTWTTAEPKGQRFFQLLGAMASKTARRRFNLLDFTFLLEPGRWFWAATSLDSNGRPLVEHQDYGPFNVDALMTGEQTPFEGLAGTLPFGPKVYIDANVPITDKGHETESKPDGDIAIGAIWDDLWLFEGDIRTDVFDQTLSGTMEVRYRLYNYVSLLQRYGQSVAIASGTGFAPPETEDKVPFR